MVNTYKCPKCNGNGCDFCRGSGFVNLDSDGEINQVASNKFMDIFKEPHDFIWAIKNIKDK